MANTKIFREKILEIFDELKYYQELVTKKNKSREEQVNSIKEVFAKNRDADEVKNFAFNNFFMASFQNLDLQIIQTKFVSYVELYLFDTESEELPEELINAYGFIKSRLPKRMFLAKDGELVELVEGSIEAKRQKFEEENLFKIVEDQLNAALNVGKDR